MRTKEMHRRKRGIGTRWHNQATATFGSGLEFESGGLRRSGDFRSNALEVTCFNSICSAPAPPACSTACGATRTGRGDGLQ